MTTIENDIPSSNPQYCDICSRIMDSTVYHKKENMRMCARCEVDYFLK